MIRSPIRVNVVLALALAGLATSGACQRPWAKAPGPAESQASAGSSAYDAETTDIARVLAGMRPLRGQAFAALVALPEWREWEAEAQERWGAAWRDGVLPLRAWAGTALKGVASDCRTLLRPFGDTAFVDAYVMFPSCEGYVLVGTGEAGRVAGRLPAGRGHPGAAGSVGAPRRPDCERGALRRHGRRTPPGVDPDSRRQRQAGGAQLHLRGAERTAAVARLLSR
jgi:hypothetical protein